MDRERHHNWTEDGEFVAVSPAMQRVMIQARRAAEIDSPVLLIGEAGTGKKSLAAEIHRRSHRQDGPFVPFESAEGFSDSSLFGAVEGIEAASVEKAGAIDQAQNGTLYVDEIAALWPTSQARLLTAIETGQVAPMGGTKDRAVDVRFIAGTSRDLETEVQAGRFRADLYYRLNVLPIHVPPLRRRREDIPGLIQQFLARLASDRPGAAAVVVDAKLRELLSSLDWPGNVRQLRDVIERIAPLTQSVVTIENLMGTSAGTSLANVERDTILTALRTHGDNRTQAARSLGISVRTLQRRLRQWRIDH